MKTENKLEKLVKELNYWKVDYETKMAENTTKSIKFCIDAFSDFVKSKGFIVQYKDLACLASSVDFEFKVSPQFDYSKEPLQARRIKIEKNDFINKKRTEFLIGIFNNIPFAEPDLKKLLQNPYKNMTIEEIELLEKQKDLKYYKEYILKQDATENIEYSAINLTLETELGIEKDILKFYEMIVE